MTEDEARKRWREYFEKQIVDDDIRALETGTEG